MGFRNAIAAGANLVRNAIQSPNFVSGLVGWIIRKDGSAEFANAVIRGTIVAGPDTIGQSHIIIDPDVEVGFNNGFLEAVIRMFPQDPNFMMEGMLGVVTFGEGEPNAEMATVLHSPILDGGKGYGLVLAADADDLSRAAHAAIGPITAEGDAMSFIGTHMIEDYGITTPSFLSYTAQPGETVETMQTPGAGTWTAPPGVTAVKVECWGGGGRGGPKAGALAGGGGGGGEYAKHSAVAVTPGNVYNFNVGIGSSTAANGGSSVFTGDAVTTTAHGGSSAAGSTGAAGGTGTVVGTHNDGGNGASTVFSGAGGGGGAAGTTQVGGLGNPGNSFGFGGAGGIGGSLGGGNGGKGGASTGGTGVVGSAPGGGGGGSGGSSGLAPGNGATGQVRLTYTPAVIPIATSMAAMAGTDRFGNTYPAGFESGGNTVPDSSLFQIATGVGASTQALTGSAVDVTAMSAAFTTKNPNALVLIMAQWDVTVSAGVAGTGNISVGEVKIDGVIQTPIGVGPESATARGSFAAPAFPAVIPAAGAHTVNGTIRKSGTATAAISAGVGSRITVLIFDFFQ